MNFDDEEPFDLEPEEEEFGLDDVWGSSTDAPALNVDVPEDVADEWAAKEDDEEIPLLPMQTPQVFKTPNSPGEKKAIIKQDTPESERSPSPTGWRGSENSDSEVEDAPVARRRDETLTSKRWGGAMATKQEHEDYTERTTRGRLLSLPPKEVDSVTVTLTDGSRYYVKHEEDSSNIQLLQRSQDHFTAVDSLRAQAAQARANREDDEKIVYEPSADGSLWVDKYAPIRFVDLLSDEHINRQVLRAIKMWDPFVFKRAAPRPPELPSWKKKFQNIRHNYAEVNKNEPHDSRPEVNKRIILVSGPPGTGKSTLARVIARAAGYRPVEINASDERTASAIQSRILAAQTNRSIMSGELTTEPPLIILDEIDGADGKTAVDALVALAATPLPKPKGANKKTFTTEEEEFGTQDADLDDSDNDDERQTKRQRSSQGATSAMTTKKKKNAGNNYSSAFFAANSGAPLSSTTSNNNKKISGLKRSRSSKTETTKRKQALTRPIICVCNDIYAPHMRSLREASIVFQIKAGPRRSRIVARLKEVSRHEGLGELSNASLQVLVDSAQGDVRSCLHALQFAACEVLHNAKKNGDELNQRFAMGTAIVNAAKSAVLKDRAADDLDLCRRAFYRKPRSIKDMSHAEQIAILPQAHLDLIQKKASLDTIDSHVSSKERELLQAILDEAATVDAPHLVSSIHENYLQATKDHDAGLRRTLAMAHDLSSIDYAFLGPCIRGGKYELAKFAAATSSSAAFVHNRSDQPVKISPPMTGIRAHRQGEKMHAALASIENSRIAFRNFAFDGPRSQPCSGITPIAIDYAPALVQIVNNPQVRPVTAEILRPPEQKHLESLANTMCANGLLFERDHYDISSSTQGWHLRPKIDEAVTFANKCTTPQNIAPVTRLILNRLISLARLRAKDVMKKQATDTSTQASDLVTKNPQKSAAYKTKLIEPLAPQRLTAPPQLPAGVSLPKALIAKIAENKAKRRPPAGQPLAQNNTCDQSESLSNQDISNSMKTMGTPENNAPPPPKNLNLIFFAPRRPTIAAAPASSSSSTAFSS